MKVSLVAAVSLLGVGVCCLLNAQICFAIGEEKKQTMLDNPQWTIQILKSELVRKEVKLTNEQEATVKTIEVDLNAKMNEWALSVGKSSEVRVKKTLEEVAAPSQERLNEVLSVAQTCRLKEISNQVIGPSLFDPSETPEIAEVLPVSHDQRSRIEDILRENTKSVDQLYDKMGMDKSFELEYSKCLDLQRTFVDKKWAIESKALDKITKILTAPQRNRFAEIMGKYVVTSQLIEQCFVSGSWTKNGDKHESGMTGPILPTYSTRSRTVRR